MQNAQSNNLIEAKIIAFQQVFQRHVRNKTTFGKYIFGHDFLAAILNKFIQSAQNALIFQQKRQLSIHSLPWFNVQNILIQAASDGPSLLNISSKSEAFNAIFSRILKDVIMPIRNNAMIGTNSFQIAKRPPMTSKKKFRPIVNNVDYLNDGSYTAHHVQQNVRQLNR